MPKLPDTEGGELMTQDCEICGLPFGENDHSLCRLTESMKELTESMQNLVEAVHEIASIASELKEIRDNIKIIKDNNER